ncbi:MAG: hydroxymethylglutaryl-CoA synthase [Acidimicrobiales bacterium]|nr:hydroxymethylglutaryl-CoA synthase [Acidimicrobiales bacterium]
MAASSPNRGIRSIGAHIPTRRLDRAEITATFGKGGGRGTRAVASFDEDTTTMGVEACRAGEVCAGDPQLMALWFATTDPAYLDKTNATAIHAALGVRRPCPALDFGGGLRSGIGALNAALRATGDILVVASDRRSGLPTSADESTGGDGAGAIRIGDADDGPLLATFVADASATEEILDRWRTPGDDRSRAWEERFAESTYVDLATDTFGRALDRADLEASDIDVLVATGMHGRALGRATKKLGVETVADNLDSTVGNTGVAQPFVTLASVLEAATPGQTIAMVHLADGCDVVILRTTDHVAGWSPRRSVADQVEAGSPLTYGQFLAWRGQVEVEPPNRPGPNRVSASAALRRGDWKFRFTGSRDRATGMLHLPPARVSEKGGGVDDMEPVVMADVPGTIAAVTIDRLAYFPSPPAVFAIVDFDGGGRAPLELTDVADPGRVAVGDRVEPTFRRLSTADGIHNYFWKVRLV